MTLISVFFLTCWWAILGDSLRIDWGDWFIDSHKWCESPGLMFGSPFMSRTQPQPPHHHHPTSALGTAPDFASLAVLWWLQAINCSGLVQHLPSVCRSFVWQRQIFIGLPGRRILATRQGVSLPWQPTDMLGAAHTSCLYQHSGRIELSTLSQGLSLRKNLKYFSFYLSILSFCHLCLRSSCL